jgi:hypothetical protein
MRLVIVAQGRRVHVQHLDGDDVTVETCVPVPRRGGYVRAEVRGETRPRSDRSPAGELDMEAFTNPVRLVVGDPPPGYVAERAPVPARPGPRRAGAANGRPTPT